MPQITGQRTTANINEDRRVVDMANEIALLEPNAAPLTVMLKRMGKTNVAKNTEFKHLEKELAPMWDQANGAALIDATTITVDNGSYFKANDVIVVPATGEQILIDSVSGNDLTVTRAWGETSASAISDNAQITILANASEEGSNAPEVKSRLASTVANFTEIIRTPWEVSNTQEATELYGGSDLAQEQKEKGIEHKRQMERVALFGQKYEDLSGSKPRRFTGGLNQFINTNRFDAGGTLTEPEIETICRTVFRYGSKKKTMLASPLMTSALSSFAGDKIKTISSDKSYGIALSQWQSPHGVLNIINHPLLEEAYSGTSFILDMKDLEYRPLKGRDTKLKTNIQANDLDARMDEYLTEFGIGMKQEKTMMVVENVTDFS